MLIRTSGFLVSASASPQQARRAVALAKGVRRRRLATHAFYADRRRRRSALTWAEEACAMEAWAADLPDSQEFAWTLSCLGLALAHLGVESSSLAAIERGEVWLALGEPERSLEVLGGCRYPEALDLRAMAHRDLGGEVPGPLLEAARADPEPISWFHARQLAQIERRIARQKGSESPMA